VVRLLTLIFIGDALNYERNLDENTIKVSGSVRSVFAGMSDARDQYRIVGERTNTRYVCSFRCRRRFPVVHHVGNSAVSHLEKEQSLLRHCCYAIVATVTSWPIIFFFWKVGTRLQCTLVGAFNSCLLYFVIFCGVSFEISCRDFCRNLRFMFSLFAKK
jgi:hypothetical protein